jgi:hypothetical protein
MADPVTLTLFVVKALVGHYLIGKAVDHAMLNHWEQKYEDRSVFPDRRRKEARRMKKVIELLRSGAASEARKELKEFSRDIADVPEWAEVAEAISQLC